MICHWIRDCQAYGEVFGLCQEAWLKFLRLIDQTIPPERQLHLICDNYAPPYPKVQRRLARHPRFHLHFTLPARPGSTCWTARAADILEKVKRARRTLQ